MDVANSLCDSGLLLASPVDALDMLALTFHSYTRQVSDVPRAACHTALVFSQSWPDTGRFASEGQ